MKKIVVILVVSLFLFPIVAVAADEMLTMKRDLLQERVLRIQAEIGLMRVQFREAQAALQVANKELQELNAKIKASEEKTAEEKK